MKTDKITQCIFIHYSLTPKIPYNVRIYIEELSGYFDKITVLTNNKEIQNEKSLFNEKVDFYSMINQGYDFGMFYRYISKENLDKYSQIALINDSNVLINKLDHVFQWANKENPDFWGIIDSYEKPWFSSHEENYHLQSHFIVFNQQAIEKLPFFLNQMNIEEIMNEKDLKKVRRLVIDKWEIGLSQYFLKNGLKVDCFIKSNELIEKYKPSKFNLTHSLYHELAKEGYPFIKKKVILEKKKLFRRKNNDWQKTIAQFGNQDWNLTKIIESLQ